MCIRDSDVLALHVDDVVETFVGHIIAQQILQTMATQDAAAIVHDLSLIHI